MLRTVGMRHARCHSSPRISRRWPNTALSSSRSGALSPMYSLPALRRRLAVALLATVVLGACSAPDKFAPSVTAPDHARKWLTGDNGPHADCAQITAVQGVPVSLQLYGNGGEGGPYTFSNAQGLPAGVTMSSTG